ncbi:MAG: phospholipid carrier-dependent glycosyltransferase [Anaerolineae bacterium]|nr:phospholipid carrier-dependent glycosyltransferase [Anaerolineae bacterium]
MKVHQSGLGKRFQAVASLVLLSCLGLLLRLVLLGNTFQSSDNVELAARIVLLPGYAWMIREYYGVLINVLVKVPVGVVSSLGIAVTEFWWKMPVALLGTLQVPLTYCFAKRLGGDQMAALVGAAFVSVLPIHVMQSRYLYGYEVLGVFFVTLAIWSLLDFYDQPTWKRGIIASVYLGVYLISHGYTLPIVFCLASVVTLFARRGYNVTDSLLYFPGQTEQLALLRSFVSGIARFAGRFVWLFPVLFWPMYRSSVFHSLKKGARFGLFLPYHLSGFIANVGIPIALLLLLTLLVGLLSKRVKSREALLLITCGAAYLAPLFLAAPPGVTVIRIYMLMGTYFLVLNMVLVLEKLAVLYGKKLVWSIVCLCLAVTLWGTVESVFGRDRWFDPSFVRAGQGTVSPDPGSKAAGYLVRKYVPDSAKVLACHRAVEVPNMLYYFDRFEYAYYDLSLEQSIMKFLEMKDEVDVVICDAEQVPVVESDGGFERRVVLYSEGVPRMWIYVRPGVEMPGIEADVALFNRAFDAGYSWTVKLR